MQCKLIPNVVSQQHTRAFGCSSFYKFVKELRTTLHRAGAGAAAAVWMCTHSSKIFILLKGSQNF